MYVFVLYAVMIWAAVYVFRRRWPAFVILAASVPALILFVRVLSRVFELDNGVLTFVASAYEALILAVGLVVALAPRQPRAIRPCRKCRYDLHGNVSGVCPECGALVEERSDRAITPRAVPLVSAS